MIWCNSKTDSIVWMREEWACFMEETGFLVELSPNIFGYSGIFAVTEDYNMLERQEDKER